LGSGPQLDPYFKQKNVFFRTFFGGVAPENWPIFAPQISRDGVPPASRRERRV
jgi:hypothetical protein